VKARRIAPSLALGVLLVGAAAGQASAIPPGPAPDPAKAAPSDLGDGAARLLAAGNRAFKEGKFAEAEKAYSEAFTIKKGFDIAGNLGAAQLAQGKLREAAQSFAFTLRMFPITGEPALREQMQKAYDECRQGIAAVRVTLAVRGATILVDGVAAGEAPLADEVFVEPGEHVFEAKLEGYTGAPQHVVAPKGASVEVALALAPVPPPVRTVVEVAPPVQRRSLAPGIALAAAAVAGLGFGAGFLSLSAGKRSNAEVVRTQIVDVGHGCVISAVNYDPRCPSLESTLRADDTWHDVAVGSFLVGGAATLGAAAYFLWPQRRAPSGREPHGSGGGAPRVTAVTPILGSGHADITGVLVSGSF
jgi:PEGA domain